MASETSSEKGTSKQIFTNFILLSGLPKAYSFRELMSLLSDRYSLENFRIIYSSRGPGFLQISFESKQMQEYAVDVLNHALWKNKVMKANIVADRLKRKHMDDEDDVILKKLCYKRESFPEKVKEAIVPFQDIPYREQLKKKEINVKVLVGQLMLYISRRNKKLSGYFARQKERLGKIPVEFFPMRPSPVIYEYRNKNDFKIGIDPDSNQIIVGILIKNFKSGNSRIVPVDDLNHIPNKMKDVVKVTQEFIRCKKHTPFSTSDPMGVWFMLSIRLTSIGQMMIVLTINCDSISHMEFNTIKSELIELFSSGNGKSYDVTSLYLEVFKLRNKSVPEPRDFNLLLGKPQIEESMYGITFMIDPGSYFPSNTKSTEVFIKDIIDLMELDSNTIIINLARGCAYSLCFAKECKMVYDIEVIPHENINDYRTTAFGNGIQNCEFYGGNTSTSLRDICNKLDENSKVMAVLDLPRTGINHDTLLALRKMPNLRRILFLRTSSKPLTRETLLLSDKEGKQNVEGNMFLPVKCISVDNYPFTTRYHMAILMDKIEAHSLPPPIVTEKKRKPKQKIKKTKMGSRFERPEGGRYSGPKPPPSPHMPNNPRLNFPGPPPQYRGGFGNFGQIWSRPPAFQLPGTSSYSSGFLNSPYPRKPLYNPFSSGIVGFNRNMQPEEQYNPHYYPN